MRTPEQNQAEVNVAANRAFREYMRQEKIQAQETARRLLVLPTTLHQWLTGSRNWSARGLHKLAAGLGVRTGDMLVTYGDIE